MKAPFWRPRLAQQQSACRVPNLSYAITPHSPYILVLPEKYGLRGCLLYLCLASEAKVCIYPLVFMARPGNRIVSMAGRCMSIRRFLPFADDLVTYLHEEKGDRHTTMDGEYQTLQIFRQQLYSHSFTAETYLKLWFGFTKFVPSDRVYVLHGPILFGHKKLMRSRCDHNDGNNPSDGCSSRPMPTADSEGS